MTKKEFDKMRKEIQDRLYDWSVENFGSWDNFTDSCFIEGKEFHLPTKLIPPATAKEWNEAKAGGSYTDGLIEVTYSWVRGFCVQDGHNRLKSFIDDGVEEIKVIFRK